MWESWKTQEYENCANDMQTRQTDESQGMMSQMSHTKQSHKSITQLNHMGWVMNGMMSQTRLEITNDAFRCSTATQVLMESPETC